MARTPEVAVRVRRDGEIVVEAMRPPFPTRDHCVVPACAFRTAVVRAHRLRTDGHAVAMVGFPEGVQPLVDLGTTSRAGIWPGDVVWRVSGDDLGHLVALAAPADVVRLAVFEVVERTAPATDAEQLTVAVHHDAELDVTIVETTRPSGTFAQSSATADLLRDIGAHVAVGELERQANGRCAYPELHSVSDPADE